MDMADRTAWRLLGDPGPHMEKVVTHVIGGVGATRAVSPGETISFTLYKAADGALYLHKQEKEEGRTTDYWYHYTR